jgi:GGDEF domain-containing protein/pSer/pThr/pTyr-binding forkhead associated (FHA) protein
VANELEPRAGLDAASPPGEVLVDQDDGDSLIVLRSPQTELAGRYFVLHIDAISIGSGEGNHVHLQDTDVASVHAVMLRDQHGWHILDAGSPLGTHRNGILLTAEALLRDGDQLQVGQTLFQLRAQQPSARPAPKAPPEPAWDRAWGRNERHRAYPGRAREREARRAGNPARRRIAAWLEECQFLVGNMAAGVPLLEAPTSGLQALCKGLDREILRTTRSLQPLSLVLLSVEGLDEIEEARGRGVRLVTSRRVMAFVRQRLRDQETAVRHGDRIGVILPSRGADEAALRGEELRRSIEEHPFEIDAERLDLRAKAGVVTRLPDERDALEIIARAVEALERPPAP